MAKKNKKRPSPPTNDLGRVKNVGDIVAQPSPAKHSRRGGRETVDALVVAFVLAFLIRTFTAEAFVIPTGSMAPTLMGRHKDVFCEQCGTRFKVNSSDDRTDQLSAMKLAVQQGRISQRNAQKRLDGLLCAGGQCPQCRFLTPLTDVLPERMLPPGAGPVEQTADYSGDRLVVSKSAYSFHDPERWDVAVFKYPGNSQTNYIKRVTGLPGEELRIFQGDLFTRPLGSEEAFEIARKPPRQVMAMRQFVHDTDHVAAKLIEAGWPLAWQGDAGWSVETMPAIAERGTAVVRPTYQGASDSNDPSWLRYRHTPPTENYWARVFESDGEIDFQPKPQLVTDFTPYNTRLNLGQAEYNQKAYGTIGLQPRPGRDDDLGRLGLHWVGDLMVEANLEATSGQVSIDLVEAGTHYGVTLSAETGEATLWRRPFESDQREALAEAATEFRAGRKHAIRLANVDNRLLLWVDGSLVETDASYTAEDADAEGDAQVPRSSGADAGDLAPAGVGIAEGKVTVERLQLWRDGYYIATRAGQIQGPDSIGFTTDLSRSDFKDQDLRRLLELPESPELWYALANRNRVDFPIQESQLFVMGDNSGWSLDARLWAGGNGRDGGQPGGAYLERKQLVGKAVCVYWPHSWYSVPGTGRRVPAWPNFGDMRLVR